MLDSHVVEFCTLFIITTNNNDNDFKSCIAKPKLFFLFFNFISWLVYYPFVCALFVINWIKWTSTYFCVLYFGIIWSATPNDKMWLEFDPLTLKKLLFGKYKFHTPNRHRAPSAFIWNC